MSDLHAVQRPPNLASRYEAPASLDEAMRLLAEHGDAAWPVAGGTDLLVEMDRGARPGLDILVDLGRLPQLADIIETDTHLRLGALVTHNQVVDSGLCRKWALPLAQACLEIGSPQLRNRATVAGNVVTASPANDTISALLALGASVELASVAGRREMTVADFVTGFRETSLAPGELVMAISVPKLSQAHRGVFVKLGLRRAQAISVVHLAAVVGLDDDGIVTDARLALGSVAETVVLASSIQSLVGGPLDERVIADAAAAAASSVEPIDDLRATAAYRRELVEVMTRRALGTLARGQHASAWPASPPKLWAPWFGGSFSGLQGRAVSIGGEDPITVAVNAAVVSAPGAVGSNLLDWLREHAAATGVKEGCAEGECGACTVHFDGAAVMACLVPAGAADGADVTTVEGLASGGELTPIQAAFISEGAVQCGFCIPGLLMSSAMLLRENERPDADQVRAALAGNLCRCTGYASIDRAIATASTSASQ